MNNRAILLIIRLTSRANIMRLSVELLNVFIHALSAKVASHGSKGQRGFHVQSQLRCCRLIILKNKAKARKAHELLWHKPISIQQIFFPK